MNPSIKTAADQAALWAALADGTIQVIATDHAPHTLEEKAKPYPESPSGLPAVENSLALLLDQVDARQSHPGPGGALDERRAGAGLGHREQGADRRGLRRRPGAGRPRKAGDGARPGAAHQEPLEPLARPDAARLAGAHPGGRPHRLPRETAATSAPAAAKPSSTPAAAATGPTA